MPSKNWDTQVTACLLAYIDRNIMVGKEWSDGVVEALKAQSYDRSMLSIKAKIRVLEKKVSDKSMSVTTNGSACLDLDDEMVAAIAAARPL
jgi:hypothetical protein